MDAPLFVEMFCMMHKYVNDSLLSKSILIDISTVDFFSSSVRNIVFQWHRQRPQREPYRISRMESVQCLFKHWMQTHFNASTMVIEEDLMAAGIIPLTLGKCSVNVIFLNAYVKWCVLNQLMLIHSQFQAINISIIGNTVTSSIILILFAHNHWLRWFNRSQWKSTKQFICIW